MAASAGLAPRAERLTALKDLRAALEVPAGRPLVVVGIGAGAWGAVFVALLQKSFGEFESEGLVQVRRRGLARGRKCAAQRRLRHLFA